jgi:hypothetical protein
LELFDLKTQTYIVNSLGRSETAQKFKFEIFDNFKKKISTTDNLEFRNIVTMAVKEGYNHPNFVAKINKMVKNLENSKENAILKSPKFSLLVLQLNASNDKSNQVYILKNFVERLMSKKGQKLNGFSIRNLVILFFIEIFSLN